MAPVKHYYCDWCSKLLGERNCCSNPTCTCAKTKTCSFLEVPLIPQLKRRLQGTMNVRSLIFNIIFVVDPNLWNAIQARCDRINDSVDSTISVVSGSSNYKLLSSLRGFLSKKHPANISLLMNTDGVSIFRLSSTLLWPIRIIINELPPCLRHCCIVHYFVACLHCNNNNTDLPKAIWFLVVFGTLIKWHNEYLPQAVCG